MTAFDAYRGLDLPDFGRLDIATACLANLLQDGELTLLLGAGVSMSSGLPSWEELVAGCEAEVGRPAASTTEPRSGDELMTAMEAVRREVLTSGGASEADFKDMVRRHLYPAPYLVDNEYPDDLLRQTMLIALGALVMPSARGSVRDVLTLNFDDLLEWYLELHGFTTRSVTDLPTNLSSRADVTVFHPHGFLPLRDKYSPTDWMVLTRREFVKRIALTEGKVWPRFLAHLFATNVVLAVGTRIEDIDLAVHFEEASQGQEPGRIAGFVLNAEFTDTERADLLERHLIPVALGSYDAIPHFLLGVCRKAAENAAA